MSNNRQEKTAGEQVDEYINSPLFILQWVIYGLPVIMAFIGLFFVRRNKGAAVLSLVIIGLHILAVLPYLFFGSLSGPGYPAIPTKAVFEMPREERKYIANWLLLPYAVVLISNFFTITILGFMLLQGDESDTHDDE